jgi:hypothetical protein
MKTMMMRMLLLCTVLMILNQVDSFSPITVKVSTPSSLMCLRNRRIRIPTLLYQNNDENQYNTNSNSNSASDTNKLKKPQNEFSRPIRSDIILSPRSSRRNYNSNISATETELQQLAKRFKLSKITQLQADLVLTKDEARSASSATSRSTNSGSCIQVKGDVMAKVTQTCVRTNEDFEVDLEFSIFSIVTVSEAREVEQTSQLGGMSAAQIEGQLGGGRGGVRKKGKKKKRGNAGSLNVGGNLNDLKMKEIESLLQDFDVEDDIFEDENVLGSDGVIDVGELVAQMFRLKLDPYPKKPGSEPVTYTISG